MSTVRDGTHQTAHGSAGGTEYETGSNKIFYLSMRQVVVGFFT